MPFPEVHTERINKAAQILRSGGVAAFPTETGYGLGASIFIKDKFNRKGLEYIYEIKHRSFHKPLLILVNSVDMLVNLSKGDFAGVARALADRFWPGPLTMLLKAEQDLPWPLCGDTGKIGVRISSHPWAGALVEAAGAPVTATSANVAGMEMALTPAEVKRQLVSPGPDMILDGGPVEGGLPSTIVDCTTSPPIQVRKGMVALSELAEFGVVTP